MIIQFSLWILKVTRELVSSHLVSIDPFHRSLNQFREVDEHRKKDVGTFPIPSMLMTS